MFTLTRRRLTFFILALWMAPTVGAVAVGVHVLYEHHDHDTGHAVDLADLARSAEHGHHHESEAVPDHEHHLVFAPSPSVLVQGNAAAAGAIAINRPEFLTAYTLPVQRSRWGPPASLFTTHCALLI